jgi:hypothetical protein
MVVPDEPVVGFWEAVFRRHFAISFVFEKR